MKYNGKISKNVISIAIKSMALYFYFIQGSLHDFEGIRFCGIFDNGLYISLLFS